MANGPSGGREERPHFLAPSIQRDPIVSEASEQPAFMRDDPIVEQAGRPTGIGERIVGQFLGNAIDDPLELPRLGTTITGAVAGGVMGAGTPTAPGPAGLIFNPITGAVAGGILGAGMGALAPETTMQTAERLGIIPEGTRDEIGLSDDELRYLTENELLLETATGGGVQALRLAGRGVTQLTAGVGREARETAERAARQDIALMPVQVGGRTIPRGFVNVMGRFPFLGTPFRRQGEAAEKSVREAFEKFPARIAPLSTASDISGRIMDDATELVGRVGRHFEGQYGQIFERADELGVTIRPRETIGKAEEVLDRIRRQTPVDARGQPTRPGSAVQRVQDFIENEIIPLRGTNQTLEQIDGLVSKIDQEVASLEPGQARFANALLNQLRTAAKQDSLANVVGTEAGEITRALRELDREFSETMTQLFETAGAKRFQSVQRRGLRGLSRDEAMRTPVDQLSRLVLKMDSPQMIDEVGRLVTDDTFARMTAHVIDDAAMNAMQHVGGDVQRFDVQKFARQLGLDRPRSDRYNTMARMLERSGGARIQDLEDLVDAARSLEGIDIPNVSSFIARRATIGGVQSLINGVVPGLALMGGGTFAGGSLMGIATFVGGSRLISSMLANPDSARALTQVMDREASRTVRRAATVRALRFGISAMKEETGMTDEDENALLSVLRQTITAFDERIQEFAPGREPAEE